MSRFVSEGTKDDNAAEVNNDAWAQAKQAVEALKRPKQGAPGAGLQEGGISLYETLQANKEKKQADFEESQRLKNQFQALNEDDAQFLDSVIESERSKEAAVRRETAEQLDLFRKQREAAEKTARENASREETEAAVPPKDSWTKKRRRKDDTTTIPSKIRKSSSSTSDSRPAPSVEESAILISASSSLVKNSLNPLPQADQKSKTTEKTQSATVPVAPGLGLGAYDSDDD